MRRMWEGGRKDFPPTHHVSAGGWSRFAVFVRSPFRRGRALPRLASRWQSWFTLSRCQRERRFNLPEIALPLGPRLQRKTRPSRGKRKRGDSGEGRRDASRLESKSPANSTPPLLEMHRITSGVNLRTAGCVPVAGRRSDGCARGGGTGGRTTTQWCQRSRGSVTTPTALRQGQLRRFLWVLLPTTVSRDKDSCRTSAVQRLERRAAATARGSFRVPISDVWAGAGSHISTPALRFYPTRPGLARSGPRDSPGPSRAISGRLAAVGSPVPGPG